jgi:hypothetical protein
LFDDWARPRNRHCARASLTPSRGPDCRRAQYDSAEGRWRRGTDQAPVAVTDSRIQ